MTLAGTLGVVPLQSEDEAVAIPEKQRPTTLEEAVAQLKRDPAHPIRLVVDGMEIELRRPAEPGVIPGPADQSNLGDRMAAVGPWQGESTEEIIQILREARQGSRKLPDLL
jgi:hypothetical protein